MALVKWMIKFMSPKNADVGHKKPMMVSLKLWRPNWVTKKKKLWKWSEWAATSLATSTQATKLAAATATRFSSDTYYLKTYPKILYRLLYGINNTKNDAYDMNIGRNCWRTDGEMHYLKNVWIP